MPGLFLRQFRRRHLSQLFIDEWQQLLCSMGIAPFNLGQDASNVRHGQHDSQPGEETPKNVRGQAWGMRQSVGERVSEKVPISA
jgi:hypothetical protein